MLSGLGTSGEYQNTLIASFGNANMSSVTCLLTASFLHFLLPFALCLCTRVALGSAASQTSKHAFHSSCCSDCSVDSVDGHDQVQPPSSIPNHNDCDQVYPCPVDNVPEKFGQTGRVKVLSGSPQVPHLIIPGPCYRVKPILK